VEPLQNEEMNPMRHIVRDAARAIAAVVVVLVASSALFFASARAGEADFEGLSAMPPAERLEYLRGLQKKGMHSAELHFHMGNTFYALEQPDSTIAHLTMATEIDSTYSKAWVNLGITYDTMRKSRQARDAYKRAIDANPDDVLAYCHLGYNYFEAGDVDRAVGLYTRALEVDPESAQAHYNLGLAFANAKMFPEALREWNRVVEIDPDGQLGRTAKENVELIHTYLSDSN
jgi:tetratricopeptide (TPR) repeat protein